jgi:HAD superfamily phosphoserine phosphatase-like hydrolase
MKFLFDLDGTLLKLETLPLIAREFGITNEIEKLTQDTINGNIPFIESFIKRVDILSKLPADKISDLLVNIELFFEISNFIKENKKDCYIVTGNLDVWCNTLLESMGCKFFSSHAEIQDNKIAKVINIIKKEEIVLEIKKNNEKVVYIGDGNNDAEAMRLSDIAIASGLVHQPSKSVIAVADYLVYEESALLRLLNQIKKNQPGYSLIISCAGIGSRLGLSQTKALVNIFEKPIIHWQLDYFKDVKDVRIVVGFEHDLLIKTVLEKRKDVIFVFNHDYFYNKTAASFYLGSRHGNEFSIGWDGDLLVHPDDIKKCLDNSHEYLACSILKTEDGIYAKINNGNVVGFSKESSDFEWSGPICLKRDKVLWHSGNIYEMVSPYLPIKCMSIRALDIDTPGDYKNAQKFIESWTQGNTNINKYYRDLANKIKGPTETRNKAPDFSSYDINFVKKFADKSVDLLDLGSGTGLLINSLEGSFKEITAVEKYHKFSDFISRSEQVTIINEDVLTFVPTKTYNLITAFGLMMFFSFEEAEAIYRMVFKCLKKSGTFIVKHQMGVREDVCINGYSNELGCEYYANYRWIENELNLLSKVGFKISEVVDIYPDEFNRWENTKFYALVCEK